MATQRRKPLYGWGINDADYLVNYLPNPEIRNVQVMCPYYKRWSGMLSRAFSKTTVTLVSYSETTVSDDFKYFMDFRAWSIAQGLTPENRNDIDLDKDVIFIGNNRYSMEACAFIPKKINNLILCSEAKRTHLPIGARYEIKTGRYDACMRKNGKGFYIGAYDTPEAAHKAWQLSKADYIEEMIPFYKQEVERLNLLYREDVTEALYGRCILLREAAKNGEIINSL